MRLTDTQKELISRGTMAFVAIGLAVGATMILVGVHRAASTSPEAPGEAIDAFARIVVPLVVVMYILALTFGCFVFCAWDKRKSNLGRTMGVANFVGKVVDAIFTGYSTDD